MKRFKLGLMFAGLWVIVLAIAFASYPKPDNLIVGIFPFVFMGVDAVGALTQTGAILIAIIEILVIFVVGCMIQFAWTQVRNKKKIAEPVT